MDLRSNSHLVPQHCDCPRHCSCHHPCFWVWDQWRGLPYLQVANSTSNEEGSSGDVALIRCGFAALSYKTDTQPYHWIKWRIAKWIAANCLPYKIVETTTFRVMTRNLDPKCPDFGRKAITSQVGHCPKDCLVLPTFLNMFFSHHSSSIIMHSKV